MLRVSRIAGWYSSHLGIVVFHRHDDTNGITNWHWNIINSNAYPWDGALMKGPASWVAENIGWTVAIQTV